MKNINDHLRERLWQVVPIGLMIFIRLIRDIIGRGGMGNKWIGELLLAAGWVLGNLLTELDHVFYATVCNPQELTCQRIKKEVEAKNWRNAWGLLQSTKSERTKLPIRNMLTVAVILGLGIWVISSNANYLAMGVVLGLTFKLFSEVWGQKDELQWKKWYWLFARDFSETEHRGFVIAWIAVLAWEVIRVMFA